MRNLFLAFAFLTSTGVQASVVGRYNSEERAYEVTYDDLVEELSMKKQRQPQVPESESLQISQLQIGYSLANIVFDLPVENKSLTLNGAELRILANSPSSEWTLVGGFKNYSRATTADTSIENRILSAQTNRQDLWRDELYYVVGIGASGHFIRAREFNQSLNRSVMSLDILGGIRGKLTQDISWGIDFNAFSPLSTDLLKGGVATSFLVTSSL